MINETFSVSSAIFISVAFLLWVFSTIIKNIPFLTISIPQAAKNTNNTAENTDGLDLVAEDEKGDEDHGDLLHVAHDIHNQHTALLDSIEVGNVEQEGEKAVDNENKQTTTGSTGNYHCCQNLPRQPLSVELVVGDKGEGN